MPPVPLIVSEGPADDAFLRKLMAVRGITEFGFRPRAKNEPDGNGAFKFRLSGLVTQRRNINEKHNAIIIVADNDNNPAQAFKDVCDQIKGAGEFGVPKLPREIAKSNDLPPVSVLMLPWDTEPGCLDSICLSAALRQRPDIKSCLDNFAHCTGAKIDDWGIAHFSKMQLRCLFSAVSKDDPNIPLGHAWTSKGLALNLVPLEDAVFTPIAEYLRSFVPVTGSPTISPPTAFPP
jgi:hypothetical protein